MGAPGREAVKRCVALARDQHDIHACIANGENAAGGFGLTEQTADELFAAGVDFITGGNHIFDKREIIPYLERTSRVIRPENYPPGVPGRGHGYLDVGGTVIGVLNLMGRTFMPPVDDPFRCADALVEEMRTRTPVIVVDFHAEATSEKIALARHLDGRVSAVLGTHTHVQTADEQVLPGGTAFLSDLGMTGPSDGIIGMDPAAVLERFRTGLSPRLGVMTSGSKQFCAAVVGIDPASGRALEIKRIYQRGIA